MNQITGKPTILIVDDEPVNIDILIQNLQDDFRLLLAKNGKMALKIARSTSPDLILLDIIMPEIDGYTVCRQLKDSRETRMIPIIFISAKKEEEDETKGLTLGAVDYITKPFSPAIVKARINTHLKIQKQHSQIRLQRDQLVEANEKLEESAELRADVERITRHDLKLPLNGVIGFANLLKTDEDLTPEQMECIDIIEDSGYRMLNMINLSLDLYKMETGTYQLNADSVNILPLIQKIITEQENNLSKKISLRLTIDYEEPVERDYFYAYAEELLCYTMIANLIKNSIEASPEGEIVSINLEKAPQERRINIHNWGMVPEKIQPVFFNKYATSGKSGGTGLGTYSARLIATTQGGNIIMTSSENDGTRVVITLPRDEE
jgi:two-component system, sensor histidine kinase and response regulator